VAGHPILGELAGHRTTGASRGRPKTGCGLLSMWRRPQRQPTCRHHPAQAIAMAALNGIAIEALAADLYPRVQCAQARNSAQRWRCFTEPV